MGNSQLILNKPQKRLGIIGTMFFLIFMDMLVSLATDMYLPAMPAMGETLGTSDSMVKMTVTVYFLFYALGMIVWGPLSDKYGRKKILICGFVLFTGATLGCMISPNIYVLIISRIIQGIGGASASALSVAMVKDCFSGRTRERILAIVQTFSGMGPIIAPIIGSWVLQLIDWRGIFFVILLFGLLGVLCSLMYEESLSIDERLNGSWIHCFKQMKQVCQNRSFVRIVLIYSILYIPMYIFLNLSSFIFVDYFNCTEQEYSYYYAICSLFAMSGPYIYIRFFENTNKNWLTYVSFGLCVVTGFLTIIVGWISPLSFTCLVLIYSLITNMLRPFSVNLILEQQKTEVGTASSLMKLSFNLFGCAGMIISTIPFTNMITALGMTIIVCSSIAISGWRQLLLLKTK